MTIICQNSKSTQVPWQVSVLLCFSRTEFRNRYCPRVSWRAKGHAPTIENCLYVPPPPVSPWRTWDGLIFTMHLKRVAQWRWQWVKRNPRWQPLTTGRRLNPTVIMSWSRTEYKFIHFRKAHSRTDKTMFKTVCLLVLSSFSVVMFLIGVMVAERK